MTTNLLIAIKNIVENPVTNLISYYGSANRINNIGEALEFYIKDLFCNSSKIEGILPKIEAYSEYLSYVGNQNNPPDIMIKGGDAIEVKKLEGKGYGTLALNSSYPKDKISANSLMITKECRECEDWVEKDILYVVGSADSDILKSLWFVYGDCYAADKDVYERIKNTISTGIKELSDVEFSDTKEFAKIKRVDPLGITDLRIRGMWHIDTPSKAFNYITTVNHESFLTVNAILLKNKYDSFPETDRLYLENLKVDGFSIADIKIKSPNNPAKLLDAKLISFVK